jgi:hypothetical protein
VVGAAAMPAAKAGSEERMTHIALLGDSVVDNKAYVGGGPDVAEQVRRLAPKEWRVSRLALDGATAASVLNQLDRLPSDATHLVISAGGNDALAESDVLEQSGRSVGEVLTRLADVQDRFRSSYVTLLEAMAARKLPSAVCSIYGPRYPDPVRRRVGALALSIINDVITREAFARQFTVIDLRVIFNDDADFANPIEPSVQGGMKLARGVQRFVALKPLVVT